MSGIDEHTGVLLWIPITLYFLCCSVSAPTRRSHGRHKLAVINAAEGVLSVIPTPMVHILPQQLDGRLSTKVLQLGGMWCVKRDMTRDCEDTAAAPIWAAGHQSAPAAWYVVCGERHDRMRL